MPVGLKSATRTRFQAVVSIVATYSSTWSYTSELFWALVIASNSVIEVVAMCAVRPHSEFAGVELRMKIRALSPIAAAVAVAVIGFVPALLAPLPVRVLWFAVVVRPVNWVIVSHLSVPLDAKEP